MNRKQKRTLLLLAAAAAVLLAVLLAVRAARSQQQKKEAEAAASAAASGVITDPAASYRELSYFNGSATLSFALDEDGNWYWKDDADFPLDQSYLTKMVNTLSALKPQQTITEGDTLEAYGLAEPGRTLTAIAGNGMTTTLALGNTTTDGDSYYMLMNGAQTPVYIISDELAREMDVSIYDMFVLPELSLPAEDQLTSVNISGAADVTLTAIRGEAGADGKAPVTWRSGGANVTDDEQVRGILDQILSLELDGCVDYRPSDGAASLCGFDEPDAVVAVRYTSGGAVETLTLTVGARLLDGDGRYVRVNDDETIYRMGADRLDAVMRAAANGLSGDAPAADSAEG